MKCKKFGGFGVTISGSQGSLLTPCPGITLAGLGGPYQVVGIEPRSIAGKASTLPSLITFQFKTFKKNVYINTENTQWEKPKTWNTDLGFKTLKLFFIKLCL